MEQVTGALHTVVLDFLASIGWTTSLQWSSTVQLDLTPNISYAADLDWTTGITLSWNPAFSFAVPTPGVTEPSVSGYVHVTTDVIAITLHPIETPDPSLIETWQGKVPVTAKITIENLLEQPQNVSIYWWVTEHGNDIILVNSSRVVELDYPFNTKVTAIIHFVLSIEKNLVPTLDKTYKFQTEITHYEGIRAEKTGLSTLFTLSDAAVQHEKRLIFVGLFVGIMTVVGVTVYFQRKTRKPSEEE